MKMMSAKNKGPEKLFGGIYKFCDQLYPIYDSLNGNLAKIADELPSWDHEDCLSISEIENFGWGKMVIRIKILSPLPNDISVNSLTRNVHKVCLKYLPTVKPNKVVCSNEYYDGNLNSYGSYGSISFYIELK